MTSLRSFAACFAVLTLFAAATPAARAQTTVFNDTFGAGSTINNPTPTPAAPTINATAYQQISAKSFQPTSVASGHLKYGLPATSSAVNMVEALFSQYPVTLTNTGDYVQLTVTFTAESAMLDYSASGLFFGLYNASQVQPKPGGLANSTAGSAGNAQNWTGYVSRIMSSASSHVVITRSAQGAAVANNQDVVYAYSNPAGTTVGSGTTSTIAALTAATQYTGLFTITKTGATALSINSVLYQGADATGPQLFTQTVAASSILTASYDALAFGFRATASSTAAGHVEIMDVNQVKVTTNAATTIVPVISTQPFAQTKSVGENVNLSVVANGGGAPAAALSYQWYKDDVALALVDNATAQSATLTIASGQLTDTGNYKVVVTNVAGSVTSDTVLLTITNGPVPPSVLTDPTGATILVGGAKTFTVLANGTAPLTYQWQFSNDGGATYSDIVGATADSYAVTNAALAQAGRYRVVITNDQGSATSAAAILVVNQAPQISVQPVGGSFALGAPISLSVTATGTPAPTYQWKKNGVNISGATSATYSIASAAGTHTANYTVVVTNSVGSVTSSPASVAVLAASMNATAVTPANNATGRNPDTRLAITFDTAVTPGVSGFIRICDASNDAVVDTIDLVAATTLRDTLRAASTLSTLNLPVQNKSIGGTTNFNYYPVTVSGNTATIYPRDGVLALNKSYYVKIDAGAFVNAAGESFAGIGDKTTWTFTTKAAGPAAGATLITVAADGSGDFDTVQGALDFVPAANAIPRTIFIKNGSYFEEVVLVNKNYLTLQGESRTGTTIVYPNNNNFNNVSGGIYHRSTVIASGVHDTLFTNLKFLNSTPQNGSQAEALVVAGSGALTSKNIITKCSFYSYQDTLQVNKQCYISDSYIEGDVDFMWGDGPIFLENCDIKILRTASYFTQIRNGNATHGWVFHNCRFTAATGITGTYFGRIDPNGFPYSEVVIIDAVFGNATNNAFLNTTTGASGTDYKGAWWLLNGTTTATPAANVHNWTYNVVDKDGLALTDGNSDTFTNMPTDATTLANFRDATWVLNTPWSGGAIPGGAWTPSLLPTFLTQPQSQSVLFSTPVTLTVDVGAVPAATLQWRKNNVDIVGATNPTFSIPSASVGDAGDYTCVATNSAGSVTSATATLVIADPAILTQPTNVTVNVGAPATFSVSATGSSSLSYQWRKGVADIGGATGPSYTIPSVTTADAGNYSVVVTDLAGSVTSTAATLTVNVVLPAITTQPLSQSAVAGGTATFTAAASGSAPLTYQWYKDGVALGGQTSTTLSLNPVGAADAASYTVVATNEGGTATSSAAILTVNSPANALATFLAGYGIDPTNAANLSLDSDGDGVSNLLEFVLGGNPNTPEFSLLPVPSYVGGALVLDFNRRKSSAGVTVGVESSGNFAAWTPAVDGVNGVVVLTTPVDANFDHLQVAIPTADPKLFARVTASAVLPPTITAAPAAVSIAPGGDATFTVTATGGGTLTYQWFKNGSAIAGATNSSFSIVGATVADEGDYSVVVSNSTGFLTSSAAHLAVTTLPANRVFKLEGFATMGAGITGGGSVNWAAPGANYVVITAASLPSPLIALRNALQNETPTVVELQTDVDLGPLKNESHQPVISPDLIASGVGRIFVGSNKTLFSVNGATLSHGVLELNAKSNIIIRNLKFRGLWEWDDLSDDLASPSPGGYKVMNWDYVRVQSNTFNVWIDHCDLEKSYDGMIDVTSGSDLVTVSWTRISGDTEGRAATMINYLESLYQANPANPAINYYASLRSGGKSVASILALELAHDKCNLVGNGENNLAEDGGRLNVTFHHDLYRAIRQRCPRMRYGNAHVYNVYNDETSLVGTGVSSVGCASTTSSVILVENTYFNETTVPLDCTTSTDNILGFISQTGSTWIKNSADVSGTLNSQPNISPRASLLFNVPDNFPWSDRTVVPYAYTLDPVDFTKNNPALVGVITASSPADAQRLREKLVQTNP